MSTEKEGGVVGSNFQKFGRVALRLFNLSRHRISDTNTITPTCTWREDERRPAENRERVAAKDQRPWNDEDHATENDTIFMVEACGWGSGGGGGGFFSRETSG